MPHPSALNLKVALFYFLTYSFSVISEDDERYPVSCKYLCRGGQVQRGPGDSGEQGIARENYTGKHLS